MSKLPDFVTRSVPRSEPASRVRALEAEVEALQADVARLKRELAEARGGAPKPIRKTKRKPRFGEQQFEG